MAKSETTSEALTPCVQMHQVIAYMESLLQHLHTVHWTYLAIVKNSMLHFKAICPHTY